MQNLHSNNESEATLFGSAIHKALEHWYCLPKGERELTKKDAERAETLVHNHDERYSGALESIRQFTLRGSNLSLLDDSDKRSLSNGIRILKAYFKHYINDGLEIVYDPQGNPYVEKDLEFRLYEDPELIINYFGTVDAIMRNASSGHVMVVDHKTTATLGSQFYNRIKPNHQYTGYLLAAQRCLGINTNIFLVNGIQVAKTKCEFARQATDRFEEDFQEFTASVISGVKQYLDAMNANNFPMYAPNPCSNYGSCQYLDICSAPSKLRQTIIQSKFKGEQV